MFDPTRSKEKPNHPERIRKRVYGRRLGRPLRQERMDALEKALPKFEITPDTIKDIQHDGPIWLEIGFGNGEHLIWQAKNNPDTLLIGCEPFLNGVSMLLKDAEQEELENIRVWADDAREILEKMPDNSVERLFVLHPDPWPKKRHHKRRFIQTETLNQFSRILKKGAILRMASDHPGVAEWMLEKAVNHPDFDWNAQSCEDWRNRPADWPQTRYEIKGLEAGRKPYCMEFTKTA